MMALNRDCNLLAEECLRESRLLSPLFQSPYRLAVLYGYYARTDKPYISERAGIVTWLFRLVMLILTTKTGDCVS